MVDFKLTLLHDDDSSFVDMTSDLAEFSSRDTQTLALDKDADYIYFGLYKPFRGFYGAFGTANTNANTLAFEYYNGSTWATQTIEDDTKGFTRNGHIRFTPAADWESVEINSISKFYVRCRPSVTHTSTIILGFNVLFADDRDLLREFPQITRTTFLQGSATHLLIHEAVRNRIVQSLRSGGYFKVNVASLPVKITPFDILDAEEIRQGAIFLALSIIFYNVSDGADDHWYRKAADYENRYRGQLKLFQVHLDTDDDGAIDNGERSKFSSVIRIRR